MIQMDLFAPLAATCQAHELPYSPLSENAGTWSPKVPPLIHRNTMPNKYQNFKINSSTSELNRNNYSLPLWRCFAWVVCGAVSAATSSLVAELAVLYSFPYCTRWNLSRSKNKPFQKYNNDLYYMVQPSQTRKPFKWELTYCLGELHNRNSCKAILRLRPLILVWFREGSEAYESCLGGVVLIGFCPF
jgi:hypothetical protein